MGPLILRRAQDEREGAAEPQRLFAVRSFDSPSAAAPGGSG